MARRKYSAGPCYLTSIICNKRVNGAEARSLQGAKNRSAQDYSCLLAVNSRSESAVAGRGANHNQSAGRDGLAVVGGGRAGRELDRIRAGARADRGRAQVCVQVAQSSRVSVARIRRLPRGLRVGDGLHI